MNIKFKLMLAIDLLILLTVGMFGGIIYTSEKAILQHQALSDRESVLQSLSKVTMESLLSEDPELLISYTADLKRIITNLDTAYVSDGKKILAHTDPSLAPRQLPLSYSGRRIRTTADKLMVKTDVTETDRKGISFSKKNITVNSRSYTVAVGFSDLKVRDEIETALNSSIVRILKAAALVFLAATLLAIWLSVRMTSPIKKLVKAFVITGEGRLDYKLKANGRRDEIGTLNKEFNRMVDKLRELDQMKKDFVSSVTHELKSPVGAIESYLDLMSYELSRSVKDPESCAAKLPRFQENIAFIKQNSQRLLRFITDLLDAARIEKGKFEIVKKRARIEPVIQDAIKLFLERAKASGIELKFPEQKAKLPEAYFDSEQISQVLINLVSNALKFTPKGGVVTVTASIVPQAALQQPETETPEPVRSGGMALRVSVADTGIGIPQTDIDKVFEKFYQVPGGRSQAAGPKGTGLGLYIVKSIVEAHGGRIFAENLKPGTRFSIELPV
ncbi:MAG: hypothetical protein AUJ51_12970 [Elusimicrobia bacterium CG1_02_56_21]|nr:MAG: hypothetical protein AUJ51_12970 [Elusimicrobia bacterium CG1_02_56_21]